MIHNYVFSKTNNVLKLTDECRIAHAAAVLEPSRFIYTYGILPPFHKKYPLSKYATCS